MTQREKAEDLRSAHLEPGLPVLVDAAGVPLVLNARMSLGRGSMGAAMAFRF